MIPISACGGTNNVDDFNKLCQDEINAIHVVLLFAEGTVTRNDHLSEFKRGLEHIAKGIEAPIIPIHMEGKIGTPLSRIFLKGILLSQTEKDAPEWINSEIIGSVDEKGFLTVV